MKPSREPLSGPWRQRRGFRRSFQEVLAADVQGCALGLWALTWAEAGGVQSCLLDPDWPPRSSPAQARPAGSLRGLLAWLGFERPSRLQVPSDAELKGPLREQDAPPPPPRCPCLPPGTPALRQASRPAAVSAARRGEGEGGQETLGAVRCQARVGVPACQGGVWNPEGCGPWPLLPALLTGALLDTSGVPSPTLLGCPPPAAGGHLPGPWGQSARLVRGSPPPGEIWDGGSNA